MGIDIGVLMFVGVFVVLLDLLYMGFFSLRLKFLCFHALMTSLVCVFDGMQEIFYCTRILKPYYLY